MTIQGIVPTTQPVSPDIDGHLNAIRRTLMLWEDILRNPSTDASLRKKFEDSVERVYKALINEPTEEPAVKARVTSP